MSGTLNVCRVSRPRGLAPRLMITETERRQRRLLLSGCRQKGASEPIGFLLAGSADSAQYVSRLVWLQTQRKDLSAEVLPRDSGSSHFLCHTTNGLYVYRKYLTTLYLMFTKRQVLKFETEACQKSARTSLVRLANQRHPARTGAGNERLAMQADTYQVGNSERQSQSVRLESPGKGPKSCIPEVRSLKIEPIGDFSRGKIKPRIRLMGNWLERAGFIPGHRVELRLEQPGSLTLRFLEQSKEVAS